VRPGRTRRRDKRNHRQPAGDRHFPGAQSRSHVVVCLMEDMKWSRVFHEIPARGRVVPKSTSVTTARSRRTESIRRRSVL
jgi:hypothetical protein